MVEWVKPYDRRPGGSGSNPAGGTSLRNFGNSVYPALPVSFGGESHKAVSPFYLVPMPGEVKYPT